MRLRFIAETSFAKRRNQLPLHVEWSLSPIRPSSFLYSRRSAKTRFYELKFYKAATGDLTQSAKMSHSVDKYSGMANGW
jgi:hypothetical protein